VATEKQRRRKPAVASQGRSIKTSLTLDADLHVRLAAASAMRGMSANAFVQEVLTEALKSIVVFDRRKGSDGVDSAHNGDRAT